MRTASLQQRKSVGASEGSIDSGRVRSLAHVRRSLLLILGVVFSISIPVSAMAIDNGESLNLGFPRLGMQWPDGTKQSVPDIARWDYMALHDSDAGIIPALRAANPDIVLFNSTNTQELTLDLSYTGDMPVCDVPNDWILTQVGSTLAASVSPTATVFKVRNPSRFRRGDIVVVEDELVKVVSVGAGTISVVRGLVPQRSAASAHGAGVRVAAVVVFWPGSIVMNMTKYCPRRTVDSSIGPETWGEYNLRVAKRLLASADWDGLFIDRSGRRASFVIGSVGGNTRSIDAKRTNTPVTDGYAAFDASYRAALLDYESGIRAAFPDRLILVNNGETNYGLLNGTSLENHPSSTWLLKVWQSRFLPSAGGLNGTYADWTRHALAPNFTTLLAYEDESSPVHGAVFVNPFGTLGWRPNYRKMRYGLGTALMYGGFFDFEMNTVGHGASGLMWFDEYDNGGRERGYMGQPVAAARMAIPPLSSADQLKGHGAFSTEAQLRKWKNMAFVGYSMKSSLSNRTARIAVTTPRETKDSSAQLYHDNVSVTRGSYYTLSFRARASRSVALGVGVVEARPNPRGRVRFGYAQLGTGWKRYRLEGRSTATDLHARLVFLVGRTSATMYLDDVKLQTGKRWEVYRRDYSKGIALVNPTSQRVTVPLGSVYRRLGGTQDPITNNGAYTSSVSLASQDGLILLKTTPLSISSDRTIGYGTTTAVAGWLKTVGGTPLAGRKVTLYESSNQSTWTRTAAATTTVRGGYSFAMGPASKKYYRVRFFGDMDNLQGFSRVMTVDVRAYVSAPVAPPKMYRSRFYAIYGWLKPRHTAGTYPVRIYKWRYVSHRWKSYGYTNAKASNYSSYTKYSRSMRLPYAGKWRVRAYAPADSGHAATWSSGYDYVTVR